jgi:hypothetical protein
LDFCRRTSVVVLRRILLLVNVFHIEYMSLYYSNFFSFLVLLFIHLFFISLKFSFCNFYTGFSMCNMSQGYDQAIVFSYSLSDSVKLMSHFTYSFELCLKAIDNISPAYLKYVCLWLDNNWYKVFVCRDVFFDRYDRMLEYTGLTSQYKIHGTIGTFWCLIFLPREKRRRDGEGQ